VGAESGRLCRRSWCRARRRAAREAETWTSAAAWLEFLMSHHGHVIERIGIAIFSARLPSVRRAAACPESSGHRARPAGPPEERAGSYRGVRSAWAAYVTDVQYDDRRTVAQIGGVAVDEGRRTLHRRQQRPSPTNPVPRPRFSRPATPPIWATVRRSSYWTSVTSRQPRQIGRLDMSPPFLLAASRACTCPEDSGKPLLFSPLGDEPENCIPIRSITWP